MARHFPDFPLSTLPEPASDVLFLVYHGSSNFKVTLDGLRVYIMEQVGVIGTRWMGVWSGTTHYKVGDAVYYPPLGETYICISPVGEQPPETPNQSPNNDEPAWTNTGIKYKTIRRLLTAETADTLNITKDHVGRYVRVTDSLGAEVVIPDYATVPFEPGDEIEIRNSTVAVMAVTLDGAITVNAAAGYDSVPINRTLRLINVAEDEWDADIL